MGAGNFGFAFDNPKFSDRVLSIEIIPDPLEAQPNDTLVIKNQNGTSTAPILLINLCFVYIFLLMFCYAV